MNESALCQTRTSKFRNPSYNKYLLIILRKTNAGRMCDSIVITNTFQVIFIWSSRSIQRLSLRPKKERAGAECVIVENSMPLFSPRPSVEDQMVKAKDVQWHCRWRKCRTRWSRENRSAAWLYYFVVKLLMRTVITL